MRFDGKAASLSMALKRLTRVVSVMNPQKGISVRFLHHRKDNTWNNITNPNRIQGLLKTVRYWGNTPLGTVLWRKTLQPLISKARAGNVSRPVMVTIITDGEVSISLLICNSNFSE
jgi:hypothetical protein